MPANVYREVVAATNMKQRVRKTIEYFHAERASRGRRRHREPARARAGFFVRGGDGLADVKPIAHLYKTQVYDLAAHVGVPAAILEAVPTTDTYSLPQTQEEFYFRFPLRTLDLLVYASANGVAPADAAAALGSRARRRRAGVRATSTRSAASPCGTWPTPCSWSRREPGS